MARKRYSAEQIIGYLKEAREMFDINFIRNGVQNIFFHH